MMNGTKQKRKAERKTDFKRVKAKVGKRAVRPANETDTTVKISRVETSANQFGRDDNSENKDGNSTANSTVLLSSRGRSLDDLVSHLRHPAPAVRISAARGLKDAISTAAAVQGTPTAILNHLALLVPVCAKCCIDEDNEVRQLALAILKEIVTRICSSNSSNNLLFKPFVPLLMAHIISALNSLDRRVQLDGVMVVNMLSSTVNPLVTPYKPQILSAYVDILSDSSKHLRSAQFTSTSGTSTGTSSGNSSNKKDNKSGKKNATTTTDDSIKHQVLQSLVSLLEMSDQKQQLSSPWNNQAMTMAMTMTSLDVRHGGGSINAIFIPGCRRRPPNSSSSSQSIVNNNKDPSGNMHMQTTCDLLKNLRDAFAEATQTEKGAPDLQEVYLITRTAHLLYTSSSYKYSVPQAQGGVKAKADPFFKAWSQYTGMLKDMFPVSSELHLPRLVTDVNLEFCSTMLDTYLDGLDVEKRCLSNILAFLFAELQRCRPSATASSSDETLFGILEKVLLLAKKSNSNSNAKHEQWTQGVALRLMKEIASNLFADDETAVALLSDGSSIVSTEETVPLARTFAARKCIVLVKSFLVQHNWSIHHGMDVGSEKVLSRILRGLATFLMPLGGDYLPETNDIVTMLHQVVRRLDETSDDVSSEELDLLVNLRSSLVPLVKQEKGASSWFEMVPVAVQKKVLGLIVVLRAPTQALLDGLAKICARCWRNSSNAVTPGIASLISQSIHNVRRSISMQAYLGFIVSSTGISGKTLRSSEKRMDSILQFDKSIALACQFVCQCGPYRTLPMLQPLLEEWLQLEANVEPTTNKVLTARATISILGFCASRIDDDVSVLEITPKIQGATIKESIRCILNHLYLLDGSGAGLESNESILCAFLEPFVTLFQREGKLFLELFTEVSGAIQDATISCQTKLVSALLVMVNDARLSSILSRDLLVCTNSIEKVLQDSSAQQLAGRLRAAIELHCGGASSS